MSTLSIQRERRGEIALRAYRPLGLPEQSPGSGVVPLRTGRDAECIGKGRGGGQTSGKVSCFVTPPSKTGNLDGREECGPRKTQGRMPDEGDGQFGAAATQGKLAPPEKESLDGLQRDLEVEVVNHLRLQNAQLMEELDRLRALVSQKGSSSSFCLGVCLHVREFHQK